MTSIKTSSHAQESWLRQRLYKLVQITKANNKFCREKRNFEPVTDTEICVRFCRIINYCLVMASQSQRNVEFFGESEKEQMIERTWISLVENRKILHLQQRSRVTRHQHHRLLGFRTIRPGMIRVKSRNMHRPWLIYVPGSGMFCSCRLVS